MRTSSTLTAPRRSARPDRTFGLLLLATLFVAACGDDGPSGPGFSFSSASSSVLIGDTLALSSTLRGATAGATVQWITDRPGVATVDADGRVVGVADGTATIRATQGTSTATTAITVYSGLVSGNLVVASPASGVTVTSSAAEIAAGSMTVQRSGSAPPVAVGAVLVGDVQGGFLRRVTAVSGTGTTQTLTTVPASLTEAVEDLDFDIEEDFDIEASLRAAVEDARLRGNPLSHITLSPGGMANISGTLNFQQTASVGPAAVTVRLDGAVAVNMGAKAVPGAKSLEFKLRIEDFELKRLTVASTIGATFKGSASATISGSIGGTVPFGRLEADVLPPIILTKGGPFDVKCVTVAVIFPVCYKVSIRFVGYVAPIASVTGTVSQSFDLDYAIRAGIEYRNNRWSLIHSPSWLATVDEPQYTLGGTVGLRFGVAPQLEVLLYDAAGPYIGLDMGVRAEGRTDGPYQWSTSIDAMLDLIVGARAKVFGHTLAEYNASLNLLALNLYGESGPTAELAIVPPGPVNIPIGETRQMTGTAVSLFPGISFGPPTVEWLSGSPLIASVSPSGLVTAVAPGTAVIGARIAGTNIQSTAQVVVVHSGPQLGVDGCFSLNGTMCTAISAFSRGSTYFLIMGADNPATGVAECGVNIAYTDPFGPAGSAVTAPVAGLGGGCFIVLQRTVPQAQPFGQYSWQIGPATKLGFTPSATRTFNLSVNN